MGEATEGEILMWLKPKLV